MWLLAAVTALFFIFILSILIAISRGHTLDIAGKNIAWMQEQMLIEQYKIDQFYAYADSVFVEYAKQAGTLQARMTRLEALGGRLADMADFTEFDFTSEPAFGGPETSSSGDAGSVNILALSRELKKHMQQREEELLAIESLLSDKQLHRDSYVAGKPVETGWLTSGFGRRIDPFTGKMALHAGVDYTGSEGADIRAVASGVVSWAGLHDTYGRMVEIDHGSGLSTRYAHNKANNVKVGDVVSKGQVVAQMGSSGRSTGNHVHFEVLRQGRAVDPIQYIYRKEL